MGAAKAAPVLSDKERREVPKVAEGVQSDVQKSDQVSVKTSSDEGKVKTETTVNPAEETEDPQNEVAGEDAESTD